MKKNLLSIITMFLVLVGVQAQAQPLSATPKILVVYFSHSGSTREIANQIHNRVGGDIFEIQPEEPYPNDYEAVKERASKEQTSGYKPKLKTKIENIESYNVVFIGYPIWWGTIPAPVVTFLSEYDLAGKTIVPFCTHAGSGLRRSALDIANLSPKSSILDGIAVLGRNVNASQNEISEWLRKIKILK